MTTGQSYPNAFTDAALLQHALSSIRMAHALLGRPETTQKARDILFTEIGYISRALELRKEYTA